MQLSGTNVLGQSSGSRQVTYLDHRTHSTEANHGTARRISSRNASHFKNYESAVKGIEGLQLESDERAHY